MQSGRTGTRPARSTSPPACAARIAPSGDAWTPAAQIFVRASMRPSDPVSRDVQPVLVDPRDARVQPHLDAESLEVPPRAALQRLGERRQHLAGGLDEDHAGVRGIERCGTRA